MKSLTRRALMATLAGILLGGGLVALPAAHADTTAPPDAAGFAPGVGAEVGGEPIGVAPVQALASDCCGEITNHTNIYIKMQYRQDGQTRTGYVTPHTHWGGDGKDMDYFWVPDTCVFYDGSTSSKYNPGKQEGNLDDNGDQTITGAVCTDAAHLNSAAGVLDSGDGPGYIAGKPATEGCPSGNFCLFTEANFGGSVYQLYRCKTYKLASWNGVGSWKNNNTGGATAEILGKTKNLILKTYPGNKNASYNLNPVWFVTAC